VLGKEGWTLSPAYDFNPSIDKAGLALKIDMHNKGFDLDLTKSVGEYFRLQPNEFSYRRSFAFCS